MECYGLLLPGLGCSAVALAAESCVAAVAGPFHQDLKNMLCIFAKCEFSMDLFGIFDQSCR